MNKIISSMSSYSASCSALWLPAQTPEELILQGDALYAQRQDPPRPPRRWPSTRRR